MKERFFKEIRGWLKAQDGACCCLGDCNICSYHKCNGCLCTLLPFIQSEIELAKKEDHLKVVSRVRHIFNGYGGALSFTEKQLLDLITDNE